MIKFLESHRIFSLIIAIILAALIFYTSSLTSEKIGYNVGNFKSVAYHFLIFFLLAFFALPALARKDKFSIFVIIIVLIAYAVLDEIHQLFVPGRYCSFFDFLIDSIGILLASLFYYLRKLK